MSYYYKANFEYDGTDYCGFQWQAGLPTIQSEINEALARFTSGKVTTMGASRTDTGVHALSQFVKITSDREIDCERARMSLNQALPSGIRCRSFEPAHSDFRPNVSALKEYRYLFTNKLGDNTASRRFVANNPYPINFDALRECVAMIPGEHDFQNFVSTGSNVKTTVRSISLCEFSEVDPEIVFADSELFSLSPDSGTCYQLRIEGSGFLKHMIRHLMTALWKVGNGRLSAKEFQSLLNGPKRDGRLWKVAHPKGLFLYRITY